MTGQDGSACSDSCTARWAATVIFLTGRVRGGDHDRGDLAYGTRVGLGGDGATLRTGPFACVKAETTQEQTKRNQPGNEHTSSREGSCEKLKLLGNTCERFRRHQERKRWGLS